MANTRSSHLPPVDWKDGLIAAMSDPKQIFQEDNLTVTLFDAFPKARYHYLVVPREDIQSVKELTRDNLELLKHIHKVAENVIESVCRTEPNTPFRFGYHAVPSLNRLHLHIISQDFDSLKLKTRHHWNTFNTEYFMDSSKVIETLQSAGYIEVEDELYKSLLTLRMKCNACPERFDNIHSLKNHLWQHYGSLRMPHAPSISGRHQRQSTE